MKLDPGLTLVFLYLGNIFSIVTAQTNNTTVETTTFKPVNTTEGILVSELDRLLVKMRTGFIIIVSVTGGIFLLGLLAMMLCNLPYFEGRRRRKRFTLSDETGRREREKKKKEKKRHRRALEAWYEKKRRHREKRDTDPARSVSHKVSAESIDLK